MLYFAPNIWLEGKGYCKSSYHNNDKIHKWWLLEEAFGQGIYIYGIDYGDCFTDTNLPSNL